MGPGPDRRDRRSGLEWETNGSGRLWDLASPCRNTCGDTPPVSRLCGPVRPLPVCGKERTCPRRSGAQRGPGLRVWRMLVLEAWFRIPPCVKGPSLVRWLISLDCKHPQKGGSESEPSRGRLQPSRRAERALLRKRRSKGAGGWLLFCRRQKKKPEQSGLCSDVRAAFGFAKCRGTKRKGTLLIDPLIPDSFSQY